MALVTEWVDAEMCLESSGPWDGQEVCFLVLGGCWCRFFNSSPQSVGTGTSGDMSWAHGKELGVTWACFWPVSYLTSPWCRHSCRHRILGFWRTGVTWTRPLLQCASRGGDSPTPCAGEVGGC